MTRTEIIVALGFALIALTLIVAYEKGIPDTARECVTLCAPDTTMVVNNVTCLCVGPNRELRAPAVP